VNETSINQFYSFLIFAGIGILIVLIFDIFRVFRKSFKTPDYITYLEDIFFWIIAGFILLYSIFKFNNGSLRLYVFLGIAIGGIIYISTISKYFIKINTAIIILLKKLVINILNIITFPLKIIFKFVRKIFFKPISFIFFNFTNIFKKSNNILRKSKLKKGF